MSVNILIKLGKNLIQTTYVLKLEDRKRVNSLYMHAVLHCC